MAVALPFYIEDGFLLSREPEKTTEAQPTFIELDILQQIIIVYRCITQSAKHREFAEQKMCEFLKTQKRSTEIFSPA